MSTLQSSVREGLSAARQNAWPAAILVLFALGLVLGYEFVPAIRSALEEVAAVRERVGMGFPIISTALFGGALPFVFRRFLFRRETSFDDLIFGITFWGYKGVEMAYFYEFQAWLWGTGRDPATLAIKVLVDQAVYCPLLAVPNMTLGYLWLECGFSFRRTRLALREKGYWARALPVLISNGMLWIPAIAIVYTFPTALQLPLQNLVLVFWVLMLMLVARKTPEPGPP